MKIISHNKKIKRNHRIGQITTLISLLVLAVGLYMSFQPELVSYSFLALVIGFVLSQVGIYYGSRYGRSPTEDEQITQALKGLDDRYTLYHYMSPVPHLLVGPAGVWAITPFFQRGTITYNEAKKRWHQKGGNLYLKIFAQESLGRPDVVVESLKDDLTRTLKKQLGEQCPPVNVALVFTNPRADLQAANAPDPTLAIDKLKDLIRRKAKEAPLALEMVQTVQDTLPKESIS